MHLVHTKEDASVEWFHEHGHAYLASLQEAECRTGRERLNAAFPHESAISFQHPVFHDGAPLDARNHESPMSAGQVLSICRDWETVGACTILRAIPRRLSRPNIDALLSACFRQ